ncbi:MAG: DoxX family protein, partial [Candidatus Sulfotelmatobacter sp.]
APLALLAIAAEFFGGLGLLAGLLSRVAALGIACNMIVAIAMVHAQNGFFMNWFGKQQGEGIEYHLLVLALALTIIIRGGGAFSVDRLLSRVARREKTGSFGSPADSPSKELAA